MKMHMGTGIGEKPNPATLQMLETPVQAAIFIYFFCGWNSRCHRQQSRWLQHNKSMNYCHKIDSCEMHWNAMSFFKSSSGGIVKKKQCHHASTCLNSQGLFRIFERTILLTSVNTGLKALARLQGAFWHQALSNWITSCQRCCSRLGDPNPVEEGPARR